MHTAYTQEWIGNKKQITPLCKSQKRFCPVFLFNQTTCCFFFLHFNSSFSFYSNRIPLYLCFSLDLLLILDRLLTLSLILSFSCTWFAITSVSWSLRSESYVCLTYARLCVSLAISCVSVSLCCLLSNYRIFQNLITKWHFKTKAIAPWNLHENHQPKFDDLFCRNCYYYFISCYRRI